MTSSPAPSTTAVRGRHRARWRRAVAGVLMGGSLAVTTACGVAADAGSSGDGSASSGAAASSSGSAGSGTSDPSGSTGVTLGQGSTDTTHAVSQGS